jgi:predicted transcriptional regulator
MATVNFSVPDDLKQAFNEAFEGQNKSAIVADLMREAIARVERKARSRAAIDRILKRRPSMPVVTEKAVRKARETGRP